MSSASHTDFHAMRSSGHASRSALRIGITVDPPDWHSIALTAALEALGATAIPFTLADCGFDTTLCSGLNIPGFDGELPDAVLARAISGGTFEAVTMRLGVLHALREAGVPVWNDARTIERCVDKSTTSFLLAKAGVPTPPTWTIEQPEAAREIVRRETAYGHRLVFKPLFGAQGRGLRLVDHVDDLPDPADAHGVYYLQRYVGVEQDGFRDTRILVSRGRVVAAMIRHAETWITNIKQGGRPLTVVLDQPTIDLALHCAALVDARFCGVDIVRDADGRPWVIEVNSMPAWRGLQEVTPFDIAAVIAGDLVGSLGTVPLPSGRGARGGGRAASTPQEGARSSIRCGGLAKQTAARSPHPAASRPPSPSGRGAAPCAIAAAFVAACRDELHALKPGNVHVFADGHGWRVEDFFASAEAAAPAIAGRGMRVGERILGAIEATKAALGHNSNLGIVLLCAPLALAAERDGDHLPAALADVLAALDIEDARWAFRAIALAAPGGLGRSARHDVGAPATVGLRHAMQEAADRDRIAWQYAHDFADVFDLGVPRYQAALDRWHDTSAATLATYLAFLAAFPDSHIARKHGVPVAEAVRREAVPWADRLARTADLTDLTAGLLEFDADLKRRGLNPGTCADLTVATCFTFRLKNVLPPSHKNA